MKGNEVYGSSIEIEPTKLDHEVTNNLIEFEHKLNLVESEEDKQRKVIALKTLKKIVKEWVRELIIKKGMSENLSKDIKIRVHTFGSYQLGVCSKNSDIDTILIVPNHVTREDFFGGFYEKLKENDRVKNIQPISQAFVPLMNFELDDIEIDLIFARLSMNNIPKELDLKDVNVLKNLDRANVRSLNGYRDTLQILDHVPSIPTYKTTLIAIKHWAKNRGLYSNSFGFFGGISWAIMCAVICQIYPLSLPSTLLKKFFHLFSKWNYKNPVQLNKVVDHRFLDSLKGTPLDVWSPYDEGSHMPVLTPCYPSMNSTHNVSPSTRATIVEEFKRGEELIIKIEDKADVWDTLFQPYPFFSSFPFFICIHIFCQATGDLRSLKGWFESKIKLLTKILEDSPAIEFVRPFPFNFKDEQDPNSVYFYVGIKINAKAPNLKEELEKNISFFYQKISFEKKEDNNLTLKIVKRKDLPAWLPRTYFSQEPKLNPNRRKRSQAKANENNTNNSSNNANSSTTTMTNGVSDTNNANGSESVVTSPSNEISSSSTTNGENVVSVDPSSPNGSTSTNPTLATSTTNTTTPTPTNPSSSSVSLPKNTSPPSNSSFGKTNMTTTTGSSVRSTKTNSAPSIGSTASTKPTFVPSTTTNIVVNTQGSAKRIKVDSGDEKASLISIVPQNTNTSKREEKKKPTFTINLN